MPFSLEGAAVLGVGSIQLFGSAPPAPMYGLLQMADSTRSYAAQQKPCELVVVVFCLFLLVLSSCSCCCCFSFVLF